MGKIFNRANRALEHLNKAVGETRGDAQHIEGAKNCVRLIIEELAEAQTEIDRLRSSRYFVQCPDCEGTGRIVQVGNHTGPACERCGERCYIPATREQIEQLERS